MAQFAKWNITKSNKKKGVKMTQIRQTKAHTTANATMQKLSKIHLSIAMQNLSNATMQKLSMTGQNLSSVAMLKMAKATQNLSSAICSVATQKLARAMQNLAMAKTKILRIFGVFFVFFSFATLESKTTQESSNLESTNKATTKQNLAIDFADGIKKNYEDYAIELGVKGECKNDTSTKNKSYVASFICKYPLIHPFSKFWLREMKDLFMIGDMQARVSILDKNELKDSSKAKIIYNKDFAKIQKVFPKNFINNSNMKIKNEDFEASSDAVINTQDGLKWKIDMTYVMSSPYFKQKSLAEVLRIINNFSLTPIDDEKDEKCKEALREIHSKKSIFEAKITDLPQNIQAQCKGFMENLDFMQSVKFQIKELKILLDSKSVRNIIYEMMADKYERSGKKLTQQEFINEVKEANEGMRSFSLFLLRESQADKVFADFLLALVDKTTNTIIQNKNSQNTMIGFSIKHKQGQAIDIGKWIKTDNKAELESLIWESVGDMQWQVIDK